MEEIVIKQIEITAGYSGKISKAKLGDANSRFENVEVTHFVKEIIDGDIPTDEQRNARMLQIKNDLQKMFEADYERIHADQLPTEDRKESNIVEKVEIPKVRITNKDCLNLREECYAILMSRSNSADFITIKQDLWKVMDGIGITPDKLNEVETWKKTKERLCQTQKLSK